MFLQRTHEGPPQTESGTVNEIVGRLGSAIHKLRSGLCSAAAFTFTAFAFAAFVAAAFAFTAFAFAAFVAAAFAFTAFAFGIFVAAAFAFTAFAFATFVAAAFAFTAFAFATFAFATSQHVASVQVHGTEDNVLISGTGGAGNCQRSYKSSTNGSSYRFDFARHN
jgi:hypothetical protein